MPPDTATVLPLRRHRTRSAQDDVRAGVRLELTRRGRMLVTLAAFGLGLLVALGALLVLDVPTALAGGETRQQATVTVEPGETLWGYAEQLAPQEMGEQEYVAQVRTLNHLPTGRITAGQQIDLLVLDAAAEAVIQQR